MPGMRYDYRSFFLVLHKKTVGVQNYHKRFHVIYQHNIIPSFVFVLALGKDQSLFFMLKQYQLLGFCFLIFLYA